MRLSDLKRLRFCWPLFRIYDEEGHVGIAWRRPWYFQFTFNDVIGIQTDLNEHFVKWLGAMDSMVFRWPDVRPRDPVEYKHEWTEDGKDVCCTTDPDTHHDCCRGCCCHPENYDVATSV